MTTRELQERITEWIPTGAALIIEGTALLLIGLARAERGTLHVMNTFAEDQHHVHSIAFETADYSDLPEVPEIRLSSTRGTVAVIAPITSDRTGDEYPAMRREAEDWQIEINDAPTRERYEQFFINNTR